MSEFGAEVTSPCLGHARVSVAAACELGEGPGWDAARGEVRWVNIIKGELHRANADGSRHRVTPLTRKTSYAALTTAGDYLLVAENQLSRFDPHSDELSDFLPFKADNSLTPTRSNDARVDTHGSLWLSTMGLAAEQGAGSLYRLHHGKLTCLLSGLSIPNALCFSEDGRYAYFTDTPTGRIMRWQLDAEGWPYRAGSGYAAPCVWSDLRDAGGNPDGAVIDSEGCMWVALWGAGRVIRLDQKGRETGHVALPASQPSCLLFGGHALDTLYITTAHEGLDAPGAADGSLYAIDLSTQGVRGVEEPRLVLD